MRKLAYKVINDLIRAESTSAEVDLVLYIARIADETGFAQAVHYRAACEAMGGVVPQTYYNALRSLKEKGLIVFEKNSYYDTDIRLIGNDTSAGSYQKGRTRAYLSLDRDFLRGEKFKALTAKGKLLALHFLVRTQSSKKSGRRNQLKECLDTFFEKYIDLLQVTRETLRGYLQDLEAFFSIGAKEGMIYIEGRAELDAREEGDFPRYTNAGELYYTHHETDSEIYHKHLAEAACIRDNVELEPAQVAGVAELMAQYAEAFRESGSDRIQTMIRAFRQVDIPKRRRSIAAPEEEYVLSIPYLHKKMRGILGLA